MVAPVGAAMSEYMSRLAGISGSVAVFVTTSAVSSVTVRLTWPGSPGRAFTSATVTVKLLVRFRGGEPESVATVVSV